MALNTANRGSAQIFQASSRRALLLSEAKERFEKIAREITASFPDELPILQPFLETIHAGLRSIAQELEERDGSSRIRATLENQAQSAAEVLTRVDDAVTHLDTLLEAFSHQQSALRARGHRA